MMNHPVTGKVLVMGDDTRSFLACVRSLGRAGLQVHVAPFNFRSPALQSKYIFKVHRIAYYLNGGADWLDEVRQLLTTEQFDLVIPCEERSLLPLQFHQAELQGLAHFALPNAAAFEAFFDKHATRELAKSLGVPIAEGRLWSAGDTAAAVTAQLPLPIIAKHRRSFSWDHLYSRDGVYPLTTQQQLVDFLAVRPDRLANVFFERMCPGYGVGLSVLCNQGQIQLAFEHHRAHELKGSSYYRKSALVDPARLAAVSAMVHAVNYTGLAMFEFKVASDTEWVLLEVNARPWGSMPLPVAMGINFPLGLYQVMVLGKAIATTPYPANIYGRNLVGDLWQTRSNLASTDMGALQKLPYLLRWCKDFWRVPAGREHFDVCVADDPVPGKTELRQFGAGLLESVKRKFFSAAPAAGHDKLNQLMQKAPIGDFCILFVCQGNICRSPYAAYRLQQLIGSTNRLRIESAGMLPRSFRPSPQNAIEAAAAFGVDMSSHASKFANPKTVESAHLILVFDQKTRESFLDRYPGHESSVFILSYLDKKPANMNIDDPYGHDLDTFIDSYTKINKYIDKLAKLIKRN
jgi:protein-tyrosine-phosphatase/predicted ATP-grasp superfamily ATP-dependent carboligase